MLKPAYPGFRDRVIMVRESVLSAPYPLQCAPEGPLFRPSRLPIGGLTPLFCGLYFSLDTAAGCCVPCLVRIGNCTLPIDGLFSINYIYQNLLV